MKFALLLVIVGMGFAKETERREFPDGYWDRGWGYSQSGVGYHLTIRVDDVEAASERVEQILSAAGGSSSIAHSMGYFGGGGRRNNKTISFFLPAQKAEKAAKSLFEIGDVQNYNVQRYGGGNPLKEIDERLALVTKELRENRAALAKMPVASFFLNQQYERLTSARAKTEASVSKATINVGLVGSESDQQEGMAQPNGMH